MSPAGGLGAVVAIHDAVKLANCLSTLRLAIEDVEKVFKEYRAERYFESSMMFIRYLGKVKRFTAMKENATMYRAESFF
jgi:2-polyprenyl-6-methoxyphenol hydroxylase-like FAD-dependent oxidoreductase